MSEKIIEDQEIVSDTVDFETLVDISERNNPTIEVFVEDIEINGKMQPVVVEVDSGEIVNAWKLHADEYVEAKISRVD